MKIPNPYSYEEYLFSYECWLKSITQNPLLLGPFACDEYGHGIYPLITITKYTNVIGLQIPDDTPHKIYCICSSLYGPSLENERYLLRCATINKNDEQEYPNCCDFDLQDSVVEKSEEIESFIKELEDIKINITRMDLSVNLCSNEIIESIDFYFSKSPYHWHLYWNTKIIPKAYSSINKIFKNIELYFNSLKKL